MSYGAITPADAEVLELVLDQYKLKRIKFLEIGVYEGATARGIKQRCSENRSPLEYWGIDSGAICDPVPPFDGATFIVGDSAESFHLFPNDFDVVLLDGCHCLNHVILEVFHYGAKVKAGGFLMFHDTWSEIQQTMKDPHGPNIPQFHNSVNLALQIIGFPFKNWHLFRHNWMPGVEYGGMTAYQRLPD